MAILTQETQNKILIALGHHHEALGFFPTLGDDRPEEYIELIEELLADLNEIEGELKSARKKAMARELEGGTKVDFNNQIYMCRLRAGEIVRQLAIHVGIPIGWNRFGSAGKSTIVSQM